jgi:hypothetical protein
MTRNCLFGCQRFCIYNLIFFLFRIANIYKLFHMLTIEQIMMTKMENRTINVWILILAISMKLRVILMIFFRQKYYNCIHHDFISYDQSEKLSHNNYNLYILYYNIYLITRNIYCKQFRGLDMA